MLRSIGIIAVAFTMVACQNCGEMRPMHTVCPNCGHYEGKEVIAIKKEEKG